MQSLLHAVTLMHCKTRQGNGSKMIIVAGATKINLKKNENYDHSQNI